MFKIDADNIFEDIVDLKKKPRTAIDAKNAAGQNPV